MRVTILPKAIILTKALRVAVSIMAKGSSLARVLPLRCFLIFTTQKYQYFRGFFLFALVGDEPEVFLNRNTSCCSLPEGSKMIILKL